MEFALLYFIYGGIYNMSNELTTIQNANLPDTIDDLAKFILVGREKLNSVKAEIRAIDRLKLAEDVHKQKLDEAAMLAEAVLDAEVRMGELLKKLPKKQGKRTDLQPPDTSGGRLETKTEVIENLGLSEKQVHKIIKEMIELGMLRIGDYRFKHIINTNFIQK